MEQSTESDICTDPVIRDQWYPLRALAELPEGATHHTRLLGVPVSCGVTRGRPWARTESAPGDGGTGALPVIDTYGYLWTSLGEPPPGVFEIPEYTEPDRRSMNAGSFIVATSAPRAVENFLDMGHFPYVHTGYLGIEPHTEVNPYDVEIIDGEIWATRCEFFQPMAAATATGGQMSKYTYRVPSPFAVMLYKSSPVDPERRDVIALLLQPMGHEQVVAHNFLCLLDDVNSDAEIKRFQQIIFAQDKPILENQIPRRLPLDPRAETPIRADHTSIVYRRHLRELGVSYGVVPA